MPFDETSEPDRGGGDPEFEHDYELASKLAMLVGETIVSSAHSPTAVIGFIVKDLLLNAAINMAPCGHEDCCEEAFDDFVEATIEMARRDLDRLRRKANEARGLPEDGYPDP